MTALAAAFAASLTLCLLLTPPVRALARRVGLVDKPDRRRKIHEKVTPVAGGLAVLVATATAAALAWAWAPEAGAWAGKGWQLFGLLLAAVLLCGVGVADDFGLLRGRHKLAGQAAAAALVIAFGVRVDGVAFLGWQVDLGVLAVPFTLVFLLGAVNSLNLIDGMDGLLSSVGLITSLTIAALAFTAGGRAEALVAAALAGALLGFLRYNFPPASIFLGDCGSMLIGLVLGTLAILGSLKGPATVVLSTPLVLLTLPFFDTFAAIVRRKLTGRSIYTTDRGHLHHCLLRRGFSVRRVLAIVSTCCLATGLGVLASRALHNEYIAVVTGLSVVTLLVLTGLFGHAEAVLVKERVVALGSALFRPAGPAGRQLRVRLQGSADWDRLWVTLKEVAAQRNLRRLCLDVNAPALHEGYHARWEVPGGEGESPNLWRVEIPLAARGLDVGTLAIVGAADGEPVWVKLEALTRVLEAFAEALVAAGPHGADAAPEPAPAWDGLPAAEPLAAAQPVS